jgi:hypothetical protein
MGRPNRRLDAIPGRWSLSAVMIVGGYSMSALRS